MPNTQSDQPLAMLGAATDLPGWLLEAGSAAFAVTAVHGLGMPVRRGDVIVAQRGLAAPAGELAVIETAPGQLAIVHSATASPAWGAVVGILRRRA